MVFMKVCGLQPAVIQQLLQCQIGCTESDAVFLLQKTDIHVPEPRIGLNGIPEKRFELIKITDQFAGQINA